MKHAVMCILPLESRAENIVARLQDAGFASTDISILMPDREGVRDIGQQQPGKNGKSGANTFAGVPVEGSLSWLPGLRGISFAGIGPVIATGPIIAALSGPPSGAPIGDIAGGICGLGIAEYEAKQYEARLRSGNIFLAVHTDRADQSKRAAEIFANFGARDINHSSEPALESQTR